MIRVANLSISLGGQAVLRDVSLDIQPGRVTVILGPNGAGKSSLMRSLAGLIPSNGICIDDCPLPSLSLKERAQRIGYLPQDGTPAWNITARELVALGRLPYRSPFAAENDTDRPNIDAALKATDTDALAERCVDTLSGGELARVKLARLLAGEPRWLLVDEPLANLDPAHQRDILKLFRVAASSGKGVVLVLHQLDAALSIADDVILIRDQGILAAGPAADILDRDHLERLFDAEFAIVEATDRRAISQIW
jgi:iron complex transport system ATP-binding protein